MTAAKLHPLTPSSASSGGKLLNDLVSAAMAGVETAAARADTKITPASVASAKIVTRQEIKESIAAKPEFQHVANTETFWRKRTFWSTIASVLVAGYASVNYIIEKMSTGGGDLEITLPVVFGAVWAGYSAARAGIATKPLGK